MAKWGPVPLPDLGAPTADTHAHLDMLDDPAGALERAALAGVGLVVTVADVTETPEGTFESLGSWVADAAERLMEWEVEGIVPPDVRIILGAHPHNAKDFDEWAERRLITLSDDPRVVGVGEIGLDFHYDYSPRDEQRRAFVQQLEFAKMVGLPVVIHLREAHDEGIAMLEKIGVPENGCVIHCFTGDPSLVSRFVELGCYISFAGPITFKNADAIRAAASVVPLERVLVETDCPFMAPEPNRGKTNEPAWVVYSAARLAGVYGLPADEVARATMENARRVFSGIRNPKA